MVQGLGIYDLEVNDFRASGFGIYLGFRVNGFRI